MLLICKCFYACFVDIYMIEWMQQYYVTLSINNFATHYIHTITHLDPSLTLLAFVTTVMGSSSPILTEHIFNGFLPLALLSSIDRTIPTLYLDVSAIIIMCG